MAAAASTSVNLIPPARFIIEVCVDSPQSAINAVKGGADRLELCGNLGNGGGITPSIGLFKAVQKVVPDVPIMVMIRPRVGDFLYSDDEVDVMLEDIKAFKEEASRAPASSAGLRGFVFGLLLKDGSVDVDKARILIDEALPLEVCFHRAFDMTQDSQQALNDIINIGGVARILTSGQGKTLMSGASLNTLKQLFLTAKSLTEGDPWSLKILPGSGVNPKTIRPILQALLPHGIQEIHLSGGSWIAGGMDFRKEGMGMGDWNVWRTNERMVREVRSVVDEMWEDHLQDVAASESRK